MKVNIKEDYTLEFEEVYNPIRFQTKRESLSVIMRDGGFEILYEAPRCYRKIQLLEGTVRELEKWSFEIMKE